MPVQTWVTPQILELRFDKSYEMCDATYLFSHHYEVPQWNGTTFTRAELDEFYERERGDAHWWKKQWAGSNLPDKAFDLFIDGRFLFLNSFERDLVDQLRNIPRPFYVIMTSNEASYARSHEIAHALWYTNSEYRQKAQALVLDYKSQGELDIPIAKLIDAGYIADVLVDELHAYCGVFYEFYFKRLQVSVPEVLTQELCTLYATHGGAY